jgi:hypothetical protein
MPSARRSHFLRVGPVFCAPVTPLPTGLGVGAATLVRTMRIEFAMIDSGSSFAGGGNAARFRFGALLICERSTLRERLAEGTSPQSVAVAFIARCKR